MYPKPQWSQLGKTWPHNQTSQFVSAGGIKWHVQIMGSGPPLLLLHGTGAATHSWAGLMPQLAQNFTIIAPDLPGHGFTDTPNGFGLSLPGMSQLIMRLLETLDIEPVALIGHSAGAAICADMALAGAVKPQHLIAINGAFKPFEGLAAHIFPVAAKLIVLNPITILALAAGGGDHDRVRKLLASTGSRVDETLLTHYADLFGTAGHVNGVLGMMARWELHKLVPRLPGLATPMTLIVGAGDTMVPPDVSRHVAKLVPNSNLIELPKLGHLAHEEAPDILADTIRGVLLSP
jgi:magnesium chelatase accessory protein